MWGPQIALEGGACCTAGADCIGMRLSVAAHGWSLGRGVSLIFPVKKFGSGRGGPPLPFRAGERPGLRDFVVPRSAAAFVLPRWRPT